MKEHTIFTDLHWTQYKKAINVAILALIALVATWITSGAFDMDQVKIIAAGLVTSLTVFFTENAPSPTEATAAIVGEPADF